MPVRPPTGPLPDRGPEGEPDVGGLAPGADQPVAPRFVEGAEPVADVGIVDQELAVFAL